MNNIMSEYKYKILFFLLCLLGIIITSCISFYVTITNSLKTDYSVNSIMNDIHNSKYLLTTLDKIRLYQAEAYSSNIYSVSKSDYYANQYIQVVNAFQTNLRLISQSNKYRKQFELALNDYLSTFKKLINSSDYKTLDSFYIILMPKFYNVEKLVLSNFDVASKRLVAIEKTREVQAKNLRSIFVIGVILLFLIFCIILFLFYRFMFSPIIKFHNNIDKRINLLLNKLKLNPTDKINLITNIETLVAWVEEAESNSIEYIISEKKKLQEIHNSFSDLFIIIDFDFNILYHNKAIDVLFDNKEHSIIGRNILELPIIDEFYKKVSNKISIMIEEMKAIKNPNINKIVTYKNKTYSIDIKAIKRIDKQQENCLPIFIISILNDF